MDMDWQVLHGLSVNVQEAKSENPGPQVTPAEQISERTTAEAGIPLSQQPPFQLQHTPIKPGSVTVVATTMPSTSNQLVNGVDYTLNYQTGQLIVLNATIIGSSPGPTLLVSYSTPEIITSLAGNSAYSVGANYSGKKSGHRTLPRCRSRLYPAGNGGLPLDPARFRSVLPLRLHQIPGLHHHRGGYPGTV